MIDPSSLEWQRLRKRLQERIDEHKARLVGLTDTTMIYRTQGRAMELMALIEEIEKPS